MLEYNAGRADMPLSSTAGHILDTHNAIACSRLLGNILTITRIESASEVVFQQSHAL